MWGSLARACRHSVRLGGVAAQPLRCCRLTARFRHHHQNAATPNKEGKIKKNRKNKQHVRVRGSLLDFLFCTIVSKIHLCFIKNWIISRAAHFRLTIILRKCFQLVFKENQKTEELKYEGRWFCLFFCWQLQTRYHIFGTLSEMWPQLAGRRGED